MGNPQTGKQLYHRSSPTGVKVLSPTSGSPAWGSGNGRRNLQRIWLRSPVVFNHRNSRGLGETETPLLEGAHSVSCTSGPREKKGWPYKRLDQTYHLVLEGLLWRRGAAEAHCNDKDTGSGNSSEYSLVWALLEAAIFSPRPGPTQQPVGSSAGMPQAKQSENTAPCISKQDAKSLPEELPDKHSPWHGTAQQRDKTQLHPPVGRCQSLPPGSLHKLLIYQGVDSRSKENYNSAAWGMENCNHRKLDKMREQGNMSQTKK